MVQIGSWRIDRHDRLHLSFWNTNWRKTAVIYRGDSTVHVGPRSDFQRHNPSSPPQPVEVIYRPFAAWGGASFGDQTEFLWSNQFDVSFLPGGAGFIQVIVLLLWARYMRLAFYARASLTGPHVTFLSFLRSSWETSALDSRTRNTSSFHTAIVWSLYASVTVLTTWVRVM